MKHCLARPVLAAVTLFVLAGRAGAQTPPQSMFFPITPCRVVDTRLVPNGGNAGPVLAANVARAFQIAGNCGIATTARSVVLNVTAVNATAGGSFAIFPTGTASPLGATALSYRATKPRAASFIARLGTTGDVVVWPIQATGSVHLIFDVTGYFEDPPAVSASQLTAFANIATFGASPELVAHLRDVGINGWVTEQLAIPPNYSPFMALWPNTQPGTCTGTCPRDNYTMYPLQKQFFYNALYLPDQLRQRTAWALHKFLVISGQQLVQPSRMNPYLNTLLRNAFGSYRTLLIELTVSPAMGEYLNMRTSTLTAPNENYAREFLQLFSIGTVMLNQNGTPILDIGGNTIPTYTQYDINELSRVFSGWRLNTAGQVPGTDDYINTMSLVASNHDTGKKSLFCDWTDPILPVNCASIFPVNQTGDLDVFQAADAVMAHPNTAPYVSRQLIQNLVTSNPSPAYIGRVAAVFNNNGSGVKGDLGAVVRAIVTDTEALAGAAAPNFGILREPAFYALSLLRALGAKSANGTQLSDGVIAPQVLTMGQNVFNPDTVFSYYPNDNLLPGNPALLGPEFGIQSALTALRRANLANTLVYSTIPVGANNPQGTLLDLSGVQTLSNDPAAMVEMLNQRLCHGLLSASAKAAIVTAVNTIPAASPRQRAQQATYLVATSSQFQVER